MKLTDLGLTNEISGLLSSGENSQFSAGRITQEHKERYIVSDGENEYDAEITGNLRYSASSRSDFPAVGDWVLFSKYNEDQAIIHKVLPRSTVLKRQAVGKYAQEQIISANVDTAFILQAINNNFNINRLERYLSICFDAGIEPIVIFTKTDLVTKEEVETASALLGKRDKVLKYILLSNKTLEGIDKVIENIKPGKTYCVVGSSGVGKSTLINILLNREVQKTGNISSSTNKGRHITEHRELFVLSNGGIIIDNPGMKEVGMTDNEDGILTTFSEISSVASECRFNDCTHRNEAGCAVIVAVDKGLIDKDSYQNYLKLLKEQEWFSTTAAEKHRKEKVFGKMLKNYFKENHKNKY